MNISPLSVPRHCPTKPTHLTSPPAWALPEYPGQMYPDTWCLWVSLSSRPGDPSDPLEPLTERQAHHDQYYQEDPIQSLGGAVEAQGTQTPAACRASHKIHDCQPASSLCLYWCKRTWPRGRRGTMAFGVEMSARTARGTERPHPRPLWGLTAWLAPWSPATEQ